MRVTSNILARNLLHNIESKAVRVMTLQDQLASGRRIQRPSQDPSGTVSAMRLGTALVEIDQYLKNLTDARGWLDAAEHALFGTINALHRASELAVQGATGSLTASDRQALAVEVDQLLLAVMDLANTRHGDNYLFSGHRTDIKPFPSPESYQGDQGAILRDVGPGAVMLQVNISGDRAFGASLAALAGLAERLRTNDTVGIQESLGHVQAALDSTLARLADVGGRMQRAEFLETRLHEVKTGVAAVRTNMVDVDMAEVLVHLRAQEAAYQAALGAGARFLSLSLLDYLR
ncbi:MAG: flagellar hook-associated protein FlgL [Bacillota bacterium]